MTVLELILPSAGVLIGAVMTHIAGHVGEQKRWRRSQSTRWDDSRAAAYTDYGNALKQLHQTALRVASARGIDVRQRPLPAEQGMERLAELESARSSTWEILMLFGAPQTIVAAREWTEFGRRVVQIATGVLDTPDQWQAARDDFNRGRLVFYDHARRDLGIQGGALPATCLGPWRPPA